MINLKTSKAIRIKPISWIRAAIYAVAILLVYYSALDRMVFFDWTKEDYSHCMFIPFVVLYLLWEKRSEIAAIPSEPSWIGFVPLVAGIVFFWLGELGGEYFTLYVSFWLVLIGVFWLHLGWMKIRTMWFALAMILAMLPFPDFITTRITFQLRLISSKLGVWMLHLYGMSAYREGNVIDLGFTQLQVVDACSGLRYVMPLMVLSLLLAYWFKAHLWKRVVLFLSSIPLAIFVNSFRIAATGVLYSMFGAQVAEGFFHGFSGWLIFMFTIPFLLFEMWVLRRIPPREQKEEGSGKREERGHSEAESGSKAVVSNSPISHLPSPIYPELLRLHFLVAIGVLVLTFGLSHGIEFRQKVPIGKPFSQFPMKIGEWQGERENMEQQFLDVLKFSDYVMANYKNSKGRAVSFYVAYYQDQRKGESIHSPETCLPAGGWEFREAGTEVMLLPDGKSMPVNKAFIEKGGERQLAYYWFPMRGRVLTNLYQLKIYTFWDSLIKQRTDGALVRIIVPVSPGEQLSDAETRLRGFVGQVLPVLDEYIPK